MTSSPAPSTRRSVRAAAAVPRATTSTSTSRTSRRSSWTRSSRTSPSSRARTSASSPTRTRSRSSRPRTTPWAASRPTSRARCWPTTPPSSRACTRPARSPASPCTAPTAWAPTRCWTSTSSDAGRASPPPSTPRRTTSSSCPRTRRSWSSDQVERLRDSTGTERVAELRTELQEMHGRQRHGVPHRADDQDGGREDRASCASATCNVSIQDKGKRFNTDLLEAVELGNLLDLAEVMAVSALARKESRGGHYREDYPEPRRRQLHAPHHGVPRGRRRRHRVDPARLQAGRPDPLPADGA